MAPDEVLYFVFGGMPMGWTWALAYHALEQPAKVVELVGLSLNLTTGTLRNTRAQASTMRVLRTTSTRWWGNHGCAHATAARQWGGPWKPRRGEFGVLADSAVGGERSSPTAGWNHAATWHERVDSSVESAQVT